MMRLTSQCIAGLTGITLLALTTLPASGQENYGSGQTSSGNQAGQTGNLTNLEAQAQQTLQTFKQKDPSLDNFFSKSAGYAVFPTIGEGAFIIGGAHGKGIVYQDGQPIGEATMSKGSVGAQVGGESFSELIFFQSPQSLQQFKQGNLQFSASANAVAANAGAGAATNYRNGVAVFTASRTGLMAKASIGGQKFTYQPLAIGGTGLSGQGGTSSGASSNAPSPAEGSSP